MYVFVPCIIIFDFILDIRFFIVYVSHVGFLVVVRIISNILKLSKKYNINY